MDFDAVFFVRRFIDWRSALVKSLKMVDLIFGSKIDKMSMFDFRSTVVFLPVARQALIVEENVLYLKCWKYIGLKLC